MPSDKFDKVGYIRKGVNTWNALFASIQKYNWSNFLQDKAEHETWCHYTGEI